MLNPITTSLDFPIFVEKFLHIIECYNEALLCANTYVSAQKIHTYLYLIDCKTIKVWFYVWSLTFNKIPTLKNQITGNVLTILKWYSRLDCRKNSIIIIKQATFLGRSAFSIQQFSTESPILDERTFPTVHNGLPWHRIWTRVSLRYLRGLNKICGACERSHICGFTIVAKQWARFALFSPPTCARAALWLLCCVRFVFSSIGSVFCANRLCCGKNALVSVEISSCCSIGWLKCSCCRVC